MRKCRISSVLMAIPVSVLAMGNALATTGKCGFSGKLDPPASSASAPAQSLLTDQRFSSVHRLRTNGFPTWLSSLSGAGKPNRIFVGQGNPIVVAHSCDPANCATARAYVGFDPIKGTWGARVLIGRVVTELGDPIEPSGAIEVVPDAIAPALICAQNIDAGSTP